MGGTTPYTMRQTTPLTMSKTRMPNATLPVDMCKLTMP